MDTTSNFYAGLETRGAARHFDREIMKLRKIGPGESHERRPYDRGKAPERACMKWATWPHADRHLWEAALAPGDPFSDHGGTRAAHRR